MYQVESKISTKRNVLKGRRCPMTMVSPATYRIKLQGVLEESWSETLAGMKVVVTQDDTGHSVTTLSGRVVDQAMLLGVLNCVHDLGMPLLLVQRIDMMVRKGR
jgi:hypothetical protein